MPQGWAGCSVPVLANARHPTRRARVLTGTGWAVWCRRHDRRIVKAGEAILSYTPEASRIPEMPPESAQEIARGLKWRAESHAKAGMTRDASRAERDSQWWMTYSISIAQTPPDLT